MSTVHQKLLEVMRLVRYIQKDKRNEFHKYAYASDEAIKRAVHDAMAEVGLVFSASVKDIQREKGLGKSATETLTTVMIEYAFTDPESGTSVTGVFAGTGCDSMDKGLYKAVTGALKYALTSTFLIPTGDDPEEDTKEERKDQREAGKVAAQAVAARKIGEAEAMQAVIDATDPDPNPPPANILPKGKPVVPKISRALMERFQMAKRVIGAKAYYECLGAYGYDKSNHVPDAATAETILLAMSDIRKSQREALKAQERLEAQKGMDDASYWCHMPEAGCPLELANRIAAIYRQRHIAVEAANADMRAARAAKYPWAEIAAAITKETLP